MTPPPRHVWSLSGVHLTYRSWWRAPRAVLHGASLHVAAGERVGLVGPSGCGKSSLVRVGLGLQDYDAGRVCVLGEDTTAWRPSRWRTARSEVQLMLQDPSAMLHPYAPLQLLLEDSASLHRPDESPTEVATQLLEAVGLGHRAHALPHELSGGERRRAGLARVFTARPRLLVADEPTAGLDAHLRLELLQLLLQRAGPDCAVVLVSHDLQALAAVCDRLVVMADGRVVEALDAGELRDGTAQPTHDATRAQLLAAGWQPRTESP